jgi:radical SAM protein with 4Fe4S-binding SPASM domain
LSRFPGSFDAALAGLRLCVGAGVKTLVKHTVSNRNFGEFMRLQKLADAEGALFEVDPHVLPSVRGEVSRYALDISHYSLFFKKMKALPDKCFLDKFSKKDDNLHCDAGRSLCGVTPSGDVVPCIQLPIVLGSLKTRSLQEIWNGEIVKKFRRDEKRLSTLCERCKTRRFCSRCHGIAWWESTSWKLPAKSLCFHALAMVELSGK